MQQMDGTIREIGEDDAQRIRRIFAAGKREAPIFKIGEEITVSGGRFKVLAFGGRLLVLEGLPLGGFVAPDEVIEVDEDGRVSAVAEAVRELVRAKEEGR